MKELKGKNACFAWLIQGFGYVLTGISADRLNLLRSQNCFCCSAVLNHSPIRDPDADLLFGFGHRVAFGSRFPILR